MTDTETSAPSAGDQLVAPAPADEPAPDAIERVVRAWAATALANSPVSRATEAWNHLQQALPILIAQLKEL